MEMSEPKTPPVVIIGAGFSGIISLKICLENGLDAIVYEKTDNFGGLWRFREADQDGVPSVQRSTTINTSKEMSAFSDFPPPADYANYMHNSYLLDYLRQYLEHFRLEKHIQYNHQVLKVEKGKDFQQNGRWNVRVKNEEGEESDVVASAIFVAIGHHVNPSVPPFEGLDDFRGKVMHSHSFKDYEGMENQRALVVGVGNSAMDVAVELNNANTKVFLSTRRGAWVVRRVGANGLPFDFQTTRFADFILQHFPNFYEKKARKRLTMSFDHALYNMMPEHNVMAQHPTISDALPYKVISGGIVVKGDVDHFTPNGVVFRGEDGAECPVDAVVLATGYKISFPLLEGVVKTEKNHVDLYMRVVPPELDHPTLAIIGLIQPLGCIFPLVELQARWACQLIKGERHLPNLAGRLEEIRKYNNELRGRYVSSERHTIQVDYVSYADALAEKVGCKPNMLKTALTDPELFRRLLFGPAVPYQYRLTGPHAWPGARDAVMTAPQRAAAALETRSGAAKLERKKPNPWRRFTFIVIFLAAVAFFVSSNFCSH